LPRPRRSASAAAATTRCSRRRRSATACSRPARASGELDYLVFYDKPLLKFERLLETYLSFAPRGFRSFVTAMPVWLKDKLYLKLQLRRELAALGGLNESELPPLLFTEHHQAHAASASLPARSGRRQCCASMASASGATTSAWLGDGATLTPLWQIDFPHSLGCLYSASPTTRVSG